MLDINARKTLIYIYNFQKLKGNFLGCFCLLVCSTDDLVSRRTHRGLFSIKFLLGDRAELVHACECSNQGSVNLRHLFSKAILCILVLFLYFNTEYLPGLELAK